MPVCALVVAVVLQVASEDVGNCGSASRLGKFHGSALHGAAARPWNDDTSAKPLSF